MKLEQAQCRRLQTAEICGTRVGYTPICAPNSRQWRLQTAEICGTRVGNAQGCATNPRKCKSFMQLHKLLKMPIQIIRRWVVLQVIRQDYLPAMKSSDRITCRFRKVLGNYYLVAAINRD